jgi:5-methylcytosine-specific restriction endonuclease McrA
MKNGKRNGTGVSERFLGRQSPKRDSSTALGMTVSKEALRRRGTEERGGRGAQKEVDAKSLWKQVEDVVVPQLRLGMIDHLVYMHLLRHSHLEGKRRLHFSIPWLAHNINLSTCPTREAVRRLAACGVLRLVERSKQGHVAEVRLPHEVRGVRVRARAAARAREAARADGSDIEQVDFLKTLELRRTIHARERGRCFYCLRRIPPRLECLDHVVPRARVGCNSYRNLVSACMECNAQKGERPAEEYLRWLFREHRLGAAELRGRFEALELLAAGKLRPTLRSEGGEGSRRA